MKFFISSTFEDLKEYRRHTINYLKDLTDEKTGQIGAMEYFAASEDTSKEVCLAELESSDIVIGIYGSRFGWEEESTGRSMTEIEFDRAVELGKPIHEMYYASTDFPGGYEQPEDFVDKLKQQWETFFLGLPNHLGAIRLAASFLKLCQLQHRLLTEVWTEELRQEVIKARDKYIEISGDSYHID